MARATWWCCWPRWACCSTSPRAGAGGCAPSGMRLGRGPIRVQTRIVIAAGGTAGHVVPALSVADELRAEGAEVAFVGGERAEVELVPAAGYELHRIRAAGLDRRNPLRAARALGLAAAGTGRAARLLGELRPDAVLGAGSINEAALDAFAQAPFRVLHVAGARDYPDLRDWTRSTRYDLRPYLDLETFGQALLASDLVVARAGGSVFEIALYGRPALLIPYPHAAADHQTTNARWMTAGGAAVVLSDPE